MFLCYVKTFIFIIFFCYVEILKRFYFIYKTHSFIIRKKPPNDAHIKHSESRSKTPPPDSYITTRTLQFCTIRDQNNIPPPCGFSILLHLDFWIFLSPSQGPRRSLLLPRATSAKKKTAHLRLHTPSRGIVFTRANRYAEILRLACATP